MPTDEAAPVLHRKPQTLRKWACLENGPIRPVRINGRLAWRVSDLQALLDGSAA
ncbi:TPA: helix-turn-helix domain-containing protein [Burkholderia cepacia]|nr:helix-turn-helix domain-containing protein [Burkholderia cepacia]